MQLTRLHAAEEVVEHVAPVAQHVDDDAAVVLLAVIPRRALRRLPVALEHPVAELAAHGEDPPEEAGVDQHLQFQEPRQPQLVLHDAVLHARRLGAPVEVERLRDGGRDRLFRIDVLAGRDRLADQFRPQSRRRGVEVDRVLGVRERGVEVGRPARDAVRLRERRDLAGVASDEDRVRHDARGRVERHAALRADRVDRPDQVLVGAHPARDAVHDDAHALDLHCVAPLQFRRVTPSRGA